jgi:uncharacterized membrane protein (UPF0127 family)
MKQVLLPLAAVAAIITILGVLNKYPDATKSALSNPGGYLEKTIEKQVYNKKEITVGEKSILVEVVDNNETRAKGLSGREGLGEDEGMFFVFENQDVKPAFWMKDMKFAIDIIWINDGKVAQITKGVPPPESDTPDSKLPYYIPDSPIDYVIEVVSGFSEKSQIKEGTSVDLTSIVN